MAGANQLPAWKVTRMTVTLPRKCFISHAYHDAKVRDRLIASFPPHVEPFVFPPITVSPDQLVSTPLIEALLACDGVVYLRGGASDASFWVAFERDYALRAGKPVFSADADTLKLTVHAGSPLDLATYASYQSQSDKDRVREIVTFMRRERHFDLWDVDQIGPGTLWSEEIKHSMKERVERGGYVIVFWSRAAAGSKSIQEELSELANGIKRANDRVLFALLDDTPIPKFWLKFNDPAVQLFGENDRSAKQRLDDLVVRLYWLIFRNSEHRSLDKNKI
jgi:hypothetical protein